METVREYEDVAKEAKAKGVTVHFGHLMTLCNEKHAERAYPSRGRDYAAHGDGTHFRGWAVAPAAPGCL